MKKLIILFVVQLMACSAVMSQKKDYNDFFKEYRSQDGVVSFSISSSIFKFMLDDDEEKDEDVLSRVGDVSFIVSDEEGPDLTDVIDDYLPKRRYHDMMLIKDGKSVVSFKARESKNGVSEIIMTVKEPKNLFVMCIAGDFTEEEAKSLIKAVDIDKAKNSKEE